jgi:S-adenosylmethionine:tRNA ribosyltransferase-isomerase
MRAAMKVDLFDFELPQERIALRPVRPRDAARMLVVRGADAPFEDRGVRDLPSLLNPGDVLVFNDTRVIPAQLEGRRADGEAKIGATLHKRLDLRRWQAFLKNAKRVKIGDSPVEVLLDRAGTMPLPPYIASKRGVDEQDLEDYQTMFAREEGAVAAPTASLHFTPRLVDAIDAAGIGRAMLTLHVGAGTFLPVKADDTDDHQMHAEFGRISQETADQLNEARTKGGRIIAVGTTSLRLLESAVDENGVIQPFAGDTAIFITPGYRLKAVDGLMTNFHLPKSTLMMLVSALMGRERMMAAYAHAIANEYRFYSYGDSSLLLP